MPNQEKYPFYIRTNEKIQSRGECGRDFILPDSYPDIRKILHVSACPVPGRCEINAGKLTGEGELVCKVVFSDDTGRINCASFRTDYRVTAPVEKSDDKSCVYLPVVENVSAKAINPRKVGIRASVDMRAGVWQAIDPLPEMPPEFTSEDIAGVERKENDTPYMCTMLFSDTGREISEDIELDRSAPEIGEIVFADASIDINDVVYDGGSLDLRGVATVNLLYNDTAGRSALKQTELPFAQTVEADSPEQDAAFMAKAYIEKISALPADDPFGQSRVIELDITYSVYVLSIFECERPVVADAFSTSYNTENVMSDIRYSSALPMFRYEDAGTIEGDCGIGCTPVCVFADAAVVKNEEDGYDLAITADAITSDENGTLALNRLEKKVGLSVPDCSELICDANVRSVSCRCENGKLKVNYSVCVRALCWENVDGSYLSSMKLAGEGESTEPAPLTVYYPAPGESLWDAAKRYHVSEGAIMAANMMNSPDERPGVLLIPRRRKADYSKII